MRYVVYFKRDIVEVMAMKRFWTRANANRFFDQQIGYVSIYAPDDTCIGFKHPIPSSPDKSPESQQE